MFDHSRLFSTFSHGYSPETGIASIRIGTIRSSELSSICSECAEGLGSPGTGERSSAVGEVSTPCAIESERCGTELSTIGAEGSSEAIEAIGTSERSGGKRLSTPSAISTEGSGELSTIAEAGIRSSKGIDAPGTSIRGSKLSTVSTGEGSGTPCAEATESEAIGDESTGDESSSFGLGNLTEFAAYWNESFAPAANAWPGPAPAT